MSVQAVSRIWNMDGVTAEEKLMLLWIADNTTELGCAVMIDPYDMGIFIRSNHCRAMEVLDSLTEKGFIRWSADGDRAFSYVWLAHEGETYDPPIDWTAEAKSRSRRLAALLERDGPGCSYCKCRPLAYEIDHFIPRAKGGADTMDNLVLACAPCNRTKRDKMPEEFLADRPDLYHGLSSNLKFLHA